MVELGCSVLLWVAVVDQGFSRKQMAAILGHAKTTTLVTVAVHGDFWSWQWFI